MARNFMDEFTLASAGKHTVKVLSFTPNTEKNFIEIELRDAENVTFTTRLYSARIPYFMGSIARQTNGAVAGLTLKEIFKYLQHNSFDAWVSYNDYGLQVNYSAPRE
jgi:hypothetical protein